MAAEGYATIAINIAGNGYGPESRLVITEKNGTVTELSSGGRGEDVDRNGTVAAYEGCDFLRDCNRQTVVDLLQLVKAIQAGIDLDGDRSPDLDPNRISYHGFSYGGNLGTLFLAVEPSVSTGVLTVAGGSQMDLTRWSPVVRPAFAWPIFAERTPALAPNLGDQFEEDYVLRDQAVKVTRVAGAIELENLYETVAWIYAPGDQLSYATHLRASTLPGVPIKRVLFQMAKGDQTVPNPTASALVRAANMYEWVTLYRHDLARSAFPELPANPHSYWAPGPVPSSVTIASAAQRQIALFFATGERCTLLNACIPDVSELLLPTLGLNLFEIPQVLPEDLGFLAP